VLMGYSWPSAAGVRSMSRPELTAVTPRRRRLGVNWPWPEMLVLASAGEEYFDFIFNILQFHVENLQGKNRTVLVLV